MGLYVWTMDDERAHHFKNSICVLYVFISVFCVIKIQIMLSVCVEQDTCVCVCVRVSVWDACDGILSFKRYRIERVIKFNSQYMMTSSNGNIFRVTGSVTRSFDVSLCDLRLNKRLSKQS